MWYAKIDGGYNEHKTLIGLCEDCASYFVKRDKSVDIQDLFWESVEGNICQPSDDAIEEFAERCEAIYYDELSEYKSEAEHEDYLDFYYNSTRF